MRVWPASLVASAAIAIVATSQPSRAQSDPCALLKPAEIATLLGPGTTSKAAGSGCTWSAADGKRRLISIRPGGAGVPAATMFSASRTAAANGGAVTDEAGIGDKAFAALASFGVALTILKQDRLLQLQYYLGAAGTARDVETLRPVAKLAAAAF